MITSMRRCVAWNRLWVWPISLRSFDLDFENRVRSVTFSVLDRLFRYLSQILTTIRGCRVLFWLAIWYESLVWVIMGCRGVFSERRRSSCSSCCCVGIFKSYLLTHELSIWLWLILYFVVFWDNGHNCHWNFVWPAQLYLCYTFITEFVVYMCFRDTYTSRWPAPIFLKMSCLKCTECSYIFSWQ